MTAPPYQQRWLDRGADRIGLHCYAQPDDPAAPMVVIMPAMGVPARFYRPFATALGQAGLAVIVAELRGTGTSTPAPSRRSTYGYADLVADVAAVLAAVRPYRDGRRLLLLGHSLGGQASLLHLAHAGAAEVDGLALVAVGMPYWRAYPGRRRWFVLAFTQTIALTTALLRVWPGWGFGGRQARGVIRDWAFSARAGRFPRLSGVDPEQTLPRLRTPVLAISLERDQYVPAPAVDYLVDKLPAELVRREHFDGGADHFTWARTDGPLVERIASFATNPRAH